MAQFEKQMTGETQGTVIDLRRIFLALWNHRLIVLALTLAAGVGMAGLTFWKVKPRYAASFNVYVLNKTDINAVDSVTKQDIQASIELAAGYASAIRSNSQFIQTSLERAGLEKKYKTGQIRSALKTEAQTKSQTVGVTLTMRSASDCLKLACAMTETIPEILPEVVKGSSASVTSDPLKSVKVISADVPGSAWKGLLVGFIGAVLLVILADLFDRRIYTEREIRANCEGRFFGTLPTERGTSAGRIGEACRIVRTAVDAELQAVGGKVIGITGAERGSGKSMAAMRLAASFSQLGRRTLLIDAALRWPAIGEETGIGGPGLSGSLESVTVGSFEENAEKSEALGCDVLPSGARPEDSTRLLASPRMRELVEDAKKRYEIIIVDLPDAGGHADPYIASFWCDLMILVARKGKTNLNRLQAVAGKFMEYGKRCGYILNDTGVERR